MDGESIYYSAEQLKAMSIMEQAWCQESLEVIPAIGKDLGEKHLIVFFIYVICDFI